MPTVFAQPVAENTGGLSGHAVDNGNAVRVVFVAALPLDTCLLNTVAGTSAAALALVPRHASTGPIRRDAVPTRGPSAGPNGVAHSISTHESTPEAVGSSAPGYAE